MGILDYEFFFQILKERGYLIKERGVIQVKGKGEMFTCYVLGRRISRISQFGKTLGPAGNNSLAEVVYGMVRARKRRTGKKGEVVCMARNLVQQRPRLSKIASQWNASGNFPRNSFIMQSKNLGRKRGKKPSSTAAAAAAEESTSTSPQPATAATGENLAATANEDSAGRAES